MTLAEYVYMTTKALPREELYGLTSQMRRAAVSIPSNIAEGEGRRTNGEFLHMLGVAYGSLRELETQAILATRLKLISDTANSALGVRGRTDSARFMGYFDPSSTVDRCSWGNVAS